MDAPEGVPTKEDIVSTMTLSDEVTKPGRSRSQPSKMVVVLLLRLTLAPENGWFLGKILNQIAAVLHPTWPITGPPPCLRPAADYLRVSFLTLISVGSAPDQPWKPTSVLVNITPRHDLVPRVDQ